MAFDYRSVVVALKADVKAWVAGMVEAGASVKTLQGIAEELAAGDYDPKIGVDDAEARAGLAGIKAELDELDHTTANPDVDVDGAAGAAAELAGLDAQLDRIDHKDAIATVNVVGADRASRQTSFLVDAIATLGPAAVASSAVAVGALGAFGAAAFSAGIASAGLGIAVAGQVAQMKKQQQAITAANKSLDGQVKGTAAYAQALAKVNDLQRSFNSQFGPAASAFSRFQTTWHEFLADTADSSDSVIAKALNLASTILPKIEGIVASAGGSVSKLLTDLREFAQGPEAGAMLAFFQTHGPVAIEAFGSAIGNIGKGFVSLLMAFAPMQDGILGGLQSLTAGFADWAAQVGQTQGFQNFLAYIADTGPKVLDALGAISGALLAILKAAAPIGSITLPIITELANILALIANSPAGPALVGTALALSAVNRALTIMKAIQASQIALALGTVGTEAGIAGAKALAARAGFLALGVGLQVLASRIDDAESGTKGFLDVVGGASIGAAFGPWGAAIGAAAGALQFIAGQSEAAAAAQAKLESVAASVASTLNDNTGAITANTEEASRNSLATAGAFDQAEKWGISLGTLTDAALGNSNAMKTLNVIYAQRLLAANGDADAILAAGQGYKLLTDQVKANAAAIARHQREVVQENIAVGQSAGAAREATAGVHAMGAAYDDTGHSIRGTASAARAAADASAPLESAWQREIDLLAAARTSIDNYKAALDGLVNTDGSVFDAQRAITQGYLDMAAAVKGQSRSLDEQTTKGNANIDMFEGQINKIKDYLGAQKDAHKSPEFLTRALQNQRQALIDNATQMGFNKADVQDLLRTYGLTPHLIATLMKVEGTDLAGRITKDLKQRLDNLGKPHQIPISADAAAALAGEKEVQDGADKIDRTKPVLHISADTADANARIQALRAAALNLATTYTVHINIAQSGTLPSVPFGVNGATGMYIASGPGTKTSDSIPAWVSWGEYIHQAASVDKYGLAFHHAINNLTLPLDFVRAAGFAGGGSPGQARVTESMTRAQPVSLNVTFPGFAKEIAGLKAEIHELRTGTQNVHAVNAGEIATGVRHVAADEVAQDRAHRQTLQDMYA